MGHTDAEGNEMHIAFLGLGRMGTILAGHLIDAGHEVTVWNRTATRAAPFEGRAVIVPTPAAAVQGAQVVFTALFGPDAVRAVITSADLPFAAGAVWVDITTVGPADAAEFAAWASGRVSYVHAPVLGSLGPAHARDLGVLLGGAPGAREIARPLVALWADPERLREFDSPALAATGKLVVNLSLAVSMQGMSEALRLGAAGGLTPEQVLALTGLPKTPFAVITGMKGQTVLDGAFADTQFSADLIAKDLRLMIHTATAPLPAATAALQSLTHAQDDGLGDQDFSVIARLP